MRTEVLVGVDGSADARAALRWALDYARHGGSGIHVVHVWTPQRWRPDRSGPAGPPDDEATAVLMLRDQLTMLRPELAASPGELRASVVPGTPAAVLAELAEGAALLAVGATGHGWAGGGPDGGRIGSVARYVTRRARCPVTVVRRDRLPNTGTMGQLAVVPVAFEPAGTGRTRR